MNNTDKILTILSKSKDGDELSPQHLKIVEYGANGYLNEQGIELLDEIYRSVEAGTYRKPYHLDVEFMTYDHEGFIYFKTEQVEHYSHSWAYSMEAKEQLTKLQHQCLYLEGIGELKSAPYMLCNYSMGGKFGKDFCQSEKQLLDQLAGGNTILFSKVKLLDNGDNFLLAGSMTEDDIKQSPRYCDQLLYGKLEPYTPVAVEVCSYGNGPARNASVTELEYVNSCLDYLQDNELVSQLSQCEYAMHSDNERNDDEEMEER